MYVHMCVCMYVCMYVKHEGKSPVFNTYGYHFLRSSDKEHFCVFFLWIMDFRINSYYFTAELWLIILYNNNGVFTVRYEGNLLCLIQVNSARCFFPI